MLNMSLDLILCTHSIWHRGPSRCGRSKVLTNSERGGLGQLNGEDEIFRTSQPGGLTTRRQRSSISQAQGDIQIELGEQLEITQGAISKMEHADDVWVSTIRQCLMLWVLGWILLPHLFGDDACWVTIHLSRQR